MCSKRNANYSFYFPLEACTFGTVFLPDFVGNTAGLIVKLFIISTVVAQLLITAYSSFNSGLGTSMAENIPFIHTMAKDIHNLLIEDPLLHSKLLPTILITVALSTIFNGIVICSVGKLCTFKHILKCTEIDRLC